MSASEQPHISPSLKEQLVAYLDGELDEASSRELEELLSTDPRAREELQRMQKAWDLLDALPQAEVDQSFTESTIEMVAVAVEKDYQREQAAQPARELRKWGVIAATILAASMLGFASVASFWSDPNKQLLEDLPLLERLDQYRQVDDIEFLRGLHAANLLKDVQPQPEEPTSMADRQALVQSMSATEKEILKDKQNRFEKFPPADKQRLKALHHELHRDPDAPDLRGTMAAYHEWLLKQPLQQRGFLASLEPAARLEKVKSLRMEELRREARLAEPADLVLISSWLEEKVYDRLPEDVQREIDQLSPSDRNGALMLFTTRLPGLQLEPEIRREAISQLRERLSPAGQAKLDVLESDDERRRVFGGDWNSWVSQAIRDSIRRYFENMAADVPKEEMVAYFEKLPTEQKDDLLKLQPDSRELRLQVLYVLERRRERMPEQLRTLRPESLWWLRARGESRWPYRGSFRPGEGSPSPILPPSGPGPRRPGPSRSSGQAPNT